MIMCYVKSCHTIFCVVYCPPQNNNPGFKDLLSVLQEKIVSEDLPTPDIYMTRDFNMPEMNWTEHTNPSCPDSSELIEGGVVMRNFE